MSDGGPRARVAGALVDLAWLRERAPAWDRLLARAAYPNLHQGRHVIEAHAASGVAPPRLFAAATRGGELLALLPLAPGPSRFGWRRARAGWTSPYATNGTPLLAGDHPEAARGLLQALAAGPGPRILRFPLVALHHPAVAAIRGECDRLGWPVIEASAFLRPVLDRASPPLKPRKAIGRRRAQLAAEGAVEHRVATSGEALREVVEAFLALEAQGWKGRRGTAMASRPATAALARRLFGDAQGPVSVRADLLTLDGAPIAASLALVCGGTAHLLKSAYHEGYRRFGPGVSLEDAILADFRRTGFAERLDSATVPGGILDDLFPGRERVGDLVVGVGLAPDELRRLAALETRLARAVAEAKVLYRRMRSWADRRRTSPS